MTERFPRQRSRPAQPGDGTPSSDSASTESASDVSAFDDRTSDNAVFDNPVFDDSFVAAAPVREPSAKDRAVERHLQRHLLPDQRTDEIPVLVPVARWTIRPSHRFRSLRPLPVATAVACVLAVTALFVMALR